MGIGKALRILRVARVAASGRVEDHVGDPAQLLALLARFGTVTMPPPSVSSAQRTKKAISSVITEHLPSKG